jgi:hypothetical protein
MDMLLHGIGIGGNHYEMRLNGSSENFSAHQ